MSRVLGIGLALYSAGCCLCTSNPPPPQQQPPPPPPPQSYNPPQPQPPPPQPPPPNYHPAQPVPTYQSHAQPGQPGYQPQPGQPAPPPPGGHQARAIPNGQPPPQSAPPAQPQGSHPAGPAYVPPAGGASPTAVQSGAMSWAHSHGMAGAYIKRTQQKNGLWEVKLRAGGGAGESRATVLLDNNGGVRSGVMKSPGGADWNDDQ